MAVGRKPPEDGTDAGHERKAPAFSGRSAGALGKEVYIRKAELVLRIAMGVILAVLVFMTTMILILMVTEMNTKGFYIGAAIWTGMVALFALYVIRIWRYKFACCTKGIFVQGLFMRKELAYAEIERASFDAENRQNSQGGEYTVVFMQFDPIPGCKKSRIKLRWTIALDSEEEEFGHISDYVAENVAETFSW